MAPAGTGQAARRGVLWVPDWPVAAVVAEGVVDPQVPVAVHDNRGVVVASAPARAAGVRRGMRRRSAQQLCPELVLLPTDPVRDARAFEPLVQAVETVVAEVEVVRPGMVVFLARGPVRHVGSEEGLAELLVGTVATETGAECQVGLGDGLLTAMLAARAGVLVPAGPETTAAFLGGQDVGALALAASTRQADAETAELVDLLRRLGLRTLGAFARAGDRRRRRPLRHPRPPRPPPGPRAWTPARPPRAARRTTSSPPPSSTRPPRAPTWRPSPPARWPSSSPSACCAAGCCARGCR